MLVGSFRSPSGGLSFHQAMLSASLGASRVHQAVKTRGASTRKTYLVSVQSTGLRGPYVPIACLWTISPHNFASYNHLVNVHPGVCTIPGVRDACIHRHQIVRILRESSFSMLMVHDCHLLFSHSSLHIPALRIQSLPDLVAGLFRGSTSANSRMI